MFEADDLVIDVIRLGRCGFRASASFRGIS